MCRRYFEVAGDGLSICLPRTLCLLATKASQCNLCRLTSHLHELKRLYCIAVRGYIGCSLQP